MSAVCRSFSGRGRDGGIRLGLPASQHGNRGVKLIEISNPTSIDIRLIY
jgi:hypothetical protein